MSRIAILGGGHGAHAVAADLTLAGFEVNMYELPRFQRTFQATLKRQKIRIIGKAREGVAKLGVATTDIREAIEGVDIILVVVPAFGHKAFAEVSAPHLRNGQTIVLLPGSAGSLEFARILKEKEVDKDVTIAETATLPYGCRLLRPGEVRVYIVAKLLPMGVFPAKDTERVVGKLRELYPFTVGATNVIEAALNNPNPITHPAATLLNVGRIEYSKGEFYLYKEGITPSVARVYDVLDRERLAILNALGLKLFRCVDVLPEEDYMIRMGLLFGPGSLREAGIKMKGPSNTQDRFVTEDVPYGLVLMASLGKMLDIATPTMDSIINLFSTINQVDYWKEGRTVDRLRISGYSVDQLNTFLLKGEV